jgi:CheY-like chemotaxis protein
MGKPSKIVLVDDNHTTNFLNKMVIERSTIQTEVITFDNPVEGLESLTKQKSMMHNWLIFLDINMPVMDGWAFADAYAALEVDESNVLVMLTSSVDPRDEERARNHDVIKDYRTKPLTFDILDELAEIYFH